MKHKLSVVISAYNEESRIKDCLDSVTWVDEIIVVDNSSTDGTSDIAKKYTGKVYLQPNDPFKIDLQKNAGFEKATGDYILSIDADEKASEELKEEIQKLMTHSNLKEGYFIPRHNFIFGKKIEHSGWYPDHQLRLFKRGKGKYENSVHKEIKLDGEAEYLKEHLIHNNYESIVQFINKNMIIYAQIKAGDLLKRNYSLRPGDLIRVPSKEFLSRFFAREGYKDGLHGLFLSLFMAASELAVLGYVWEKGGFKEGSLAEILKDTESELKEFNKNFSFWFLSIKIKESKNPLRKLSLKLRNKSSTFSPRSIKLNNLRGFKRVLDKLK